MYAGQKPSAALHPRALRFSSASAGRRTSSAARRIACNSIEPSLEDLETQLQRAIQREEYREAAVLRDKIEEARFDNKVAVEEANRRFYRAFEDADIPAMARIWGDGDHVQCVHPGCARVIGREDVMESWRAILRSVKRGMTQITLEQKIVQVNDTQAFLTCTEVVDSGDSRGRMVATNIFEKQDGQWKIVMHHASPSPF